MPRPPRIHLEGALYVVTSRALADRRLFRDEQDYQAYVELLQAYRERQNFKLFAYVLLPDHLHLCIEPTGSATISAIIHDVNSRYTKYFAKRYGHTGHLFQERFKSTMFEKAPSLLPLTAFLHTHVSRSGITQELGSYAWSSYSQYATGVMSHPGPRLQGEVAEVFECLAREGSQDYERYVRTLPQDVIEEIRCDLGRPAAGSEEFLDRVRQLRRQMTAQQLTEPVAVMPSEPRPQPRPSGPRRDGGPAKRQLWSWFVASAALAVLTLTMAGRMTKHVGASRAIGPMIGLMPDAPTARLTNFFQSSTLNGTTWAFQIRPVSSAQASAAQADQVRFENGQLRSAWLKAQGFADARVLLSAQPGGWMTWEAMQTTSSGELVGWRGEWDGHSAMRGVLNWDVPGQSPRQFSFVGTNRSVLEAGHTTSEI